jgi:hypothetical protein
MQRAMPNRSASKAVTERDPKLRPAARTMAALSTAEGATGEGDPVTGHGEGTDRQAQPAEPTNDAPPEVTVDFRMPADHVEATQVHLVGDFNDWSRTATPLVRSGSHFVTTLRLPTGRTYRYKFLVDGERWENDWNADAYVSNEFGGDDSLLDLTGSVRSSGAPADNRTLDPESPGAAIDDTTGEIPEPNEPA